MKLREYHPLSEMERVPAEELPKRLDELFDRMDKENVGFVVTEEGKDSCVFCPYKWFELEMKYSWLRSRKSLRLWDGL